jgi:hypothetical protein
VSLEILKKMKEGVRNPSWYQILKLAEKYNPLPEYQVLISMDELAWGSPVSLPSQ